MKFSIIVATFNSEKTIRDTLESIKNQTHKNFEVLIIDGVSGDKTLGIASFYKDIFDIKIFSEKDKGLYDAMNKGIGFATGDIVHILNADDFYIHRDVLKNISKVFDENLNADAVYGDLRYVDRNNINKITRIWKTGGYGEQNLNNGWIIPHPVLFVRREVYEKLNNVFNIDLTISADYELILRLLKIYKIKTIYLPQILVSMRIGGISDSGVIVKLKGWNQIRHAWKLNNLKVPRFLILRRLISKMLEFMFFNKTIQ